METLLNNFLSFIPQKNHPLIPTKPPSNTKLPPPPLTTSPKLILNAFEDMINKFIDPPTRSSSTNPMVVLSSNFAPVDELPPTECHVIKGTLPKCLNGAYLRNGPNPQFFPRGPYHFFDGDGMLHCLRISEDKVTLCSRFVKTHKFLAEQRVNSNIIPNFFAGANGLHGSLARALLVFARMMNDKFDISQGIGVANTNICLFGNRLFALCESDLPYELRLTPNGDIQTLGRINFDGSNILRMTAHPKFDHKKIEGYAFLYNVLSPFLTFFRFDSMGNKHKDVPIFSMKHPSYMHDFFITKKFAIFPDIQILMDPFRMIIKGESILRFDENKVSRIGIIPKYCEDEREIRWHDVPGLNILHAINAWDEVGDNGNEIVTIVATNMKCPENGFRMEDIVVRVEKIVIDVKDGLVSRQILSTKNLELPVINSKYDGKNNAYVYACVSDGPSAKATGVVKLCVSCNTQDCVVASRMYGPGCYGGEPFFVSEDSEDSNLEEDDGYIVTFMHDENEGETSFLVMDAKTPNLDIVASIKLPQRVPYGIHGLFVKNKELKAMWDNHIY